MVIPQEFRAFKDQRYYETLIDGDKMWYPKTSSCTQFVPGISWLREKGKDMLYTACDRCGFVGGIEPGKHTVEMRAQLPGTEIEMRSQVEIDFSCPKTLALEQDDYF